MRHLVWVLMIGSLAWGDDSSAGVMLPAWRDSGGVKIRQAAVSVRGETLEVSYQFAVDKASSIHIDLPRFGWLGESEPYPDRHFPELRVEVDGKHAAIEDGFSVFLGAVDITDLTRRAGVDVYAIADTPPFVKPAAPEELLKAGAIVKSGEDYIAKWEVQRSIGIALQPGPHTLTLRYKARPAFALQPLDGLTQLSKYCTSRSALKKAGVAPASGLVGVTEYTVPIGIEAEVGVAVDAGSFIAFCSDGGKAALGRGPLKAPGRTDGNGAMHILKIGPSTAK